MNGGALLLLPGRRRFLFLPFRTRLRCSAPECVSQLPPSRPVALGTATGAGLRGLSGSKKRPRSLLGPALKQLGKDRQLCGEAWANTGLGGSRPVCTDGLHRSCKKHGVSRQCRPTKAETLVRKPAKTGRPSVPWLQVLTGHFRRFSSPPREFSTREGIGAQSGPGSP